MPFPARIRQMHPILTRLSFRGGAIAHMKLRVKYAFFLQHWQNWISAGELACIHTKEYGWLFVKRDGTTIRTVDIDNGPDNFSGGLARYIDDEKTGFIDASGRIVIKARFRFAAPFEGGFSRVCNDFVTEVSGEYVLMKSSHWGCIDKNGHVVVPMLYSAEEIPAKLNQLAHD